MPIAATSSVLRRPTQKARPKVDVLGGIVDQRLADVEAGGVVPEAEAGGDVGAREILRRIIGGAVAERGDDDDERRLQR